MNPTLTPGAVVDSDATICLHRAMARGRLKRLENAGVKIDWRKFADVKSDTWMKFATRDLSSMSKEQVKDLETRGTEVSSCLDTLHDEAAAELFGVDFASYQTRCAKPAEELQKRRMESSFDEAKKANRHLLDGAQSALQRAVMRDVLNQRALDSATDTSLTGINYLHEPFRELRTSGELLKRIPQMVIPAGFKTYTVPVVGDARVLKAAALTTDAYTVNSSEDPTSSTQTWNPVTAQGTIFWNDEFDDDSLFPVEAALRESMVRGATIALEAALINGDTTNTAAANINALYGTATLGTKDPRLLFNGFRGIYYRGTHGGKSANTFTGGISGGSNAATLTDVYDTLKGMGKYAVKAQYPNLVGVSPTQVYKNLRNDARGSNFGQDIIRDDIFGFDWIETNNGTATAAAGSNIPTDTLDKFEGVPVNLNTAGVYDNSTKTESTFFIFNASNYLLAWKKQMQIYVIDLRLGGQKAITSVFRCVMEPILVNQTDLNVCFDVR